MNSSESLKRAQWVMRRQHKALSTEECYLFWLRRYISALRAMPASLPSEKKLETFLTALACDRDVSASTQNQAFNAILFFYRDVLVQPLANVNALRATRPVHERHAPTLAETQLLLQTIRNENGYPTNLIARMLYGCGLRVSEPLNLRIKDVDVQGHRLCIRGAKGGNDRVVPLPSSLAPEIIQQMQSARLVWQQDKQNGTPLMLPHGLARKYPEYQFSWGWAWLFPAHHPCRDPRTGAIVRYRMHEVNVQRSVKHARRKLGLSVLPHELRTATQPTAWSEAPTLGLSRKSWAINHWKPPWAICTLRVSPLPALWKASCPSKCQFTQRDTYCEFFPRKLLPSATRSH